MSVREVLEARLFLIARLLAKSVRASALRHRKGGDAVPIEKVQGVAVSTYYRGEVGVPPSEGKLCCVVLVEDRQAEREIPNEVNGVKVVPIVSGRIFALDVVEAVPETNSERVGVVRPLVGGVSIGVLGCTAGTLGCFVRDADTGVPMILSNCHCIAMNWGNCYWGWRLLTERGKLPVLQPGPADLASMGEECYTEGDCPIVMCTTDVVGRYTVAYTVRWVPVVPATGDVIPINYVDAAVATLLPNIAYREEILGVGKYGRPITPTLALVGKRVIKSGRTSGVTFGNVIAVAGAVKCSFPGWGVALFDDQIVVKQVSEGGDSGSLGLLDEKWRDGSYKVFGLLFAGGTGPEAEPVTVYNNIARVVTELNILFPGQEKVSPLLSPVQEREKLHKVALGLSATALIGGVVATLSLAHK